jgi:hypothetical protein
MQKIFAIKPRKLIIVSINTDNPSITKGIPAGGIQPPISYTKGTAPLFTLISINKERIVSESIIALEIILLIFAFRFPKSESANAPNNGRIINKGMNFILTF